MNHTLTKYIAGSSAYCLLRKPLVLSKHKILTENSSYCDFKYSPLLISEIVPISVYSGMMGPFIAPLHLFQDTQKAEVYWRGLEKELDPPHEYKHISFLDLVFV